MSIATWKKEFCPIPAKETKHLTVLEALDHSIQKWVGFSRRNLKKHGLEVAIGSYGRVADIKTGALHTVARCDQCALCVKFCRGKEDELCTQCPVYITRGGKSCDHEPALDLRRIAESPWGAFVEGADPSKMLRIMRRARKQLVSQ